MDKKTQNQVTIFAALAVVFFALAAEVTGVGFPHVTNAKGLLKLFLGACIFIGGGVLSFGLASHKHKE